MIYGREDHHKKFKTFIFSLPVDFEPVFQQLPVLCRDCHSGPSDFPALVGLFPKYNYLNIGRRLDAGNLRDKTIAEN